MPGVKVKDGDSIERALKIFKKQLEKAGVIADVRKKEFYEKPSIRLKKKKIAANKRRLKQLRKFGRKPYYKIIKTRPDLDLSGFFICVYIGLVIILSF